MALTLKSPLRPCQRSSRWWFGDATCLPVRRLPILSRCSVPGLKKEKKECGGYLSCRRERTTLCGSTALAWLRAGKKPPVRDDDMLLSHSKPYLSTKPVWLPLLLPVGSYREFPKRRAISYPATIHRQPACLQWADPSWNCWADCVCNRIACLAKVRVMSYFTVCFLF